MDLLISNLVPFMMLLPPLQNAHKPVAVSGRSLSCPVVTALQSTLRCKMAGNASTGKCFHYNLTLVTFCWRRLVLHILPRGHLQTLTSSAILLPSWSPLAMKLLLGSYLLAHLTDSLIFLSFCWRTAMRNSSTNILPPGPWKSSWYLVSL